MADDHKTFGPHILREYALLADGERGNAITERWQEPDYGIWELYPAHRAHSRLICAAGLRSISRHARAQQGAQWTSLADTLVADTARDCLHLTAVGSEPPTTTVSTPRCSCPRSVARSPPTTHQQGQSTEAVRWFERSRTACGSPGLFTEEYDVEQRQLRGNVPQAFVHAVMIEAASTLAGPPGAAPPAAPTTGASPS